MPNETTDAEVADLARRLAGLLEAPEYGLFTWAEARHRLAVELYEALRDKLGKDT